MYKNYNFQLTPAWSKPIKQVYLHVQGKRHLFVQLLITQSCAVADHDVVVLPLSQPVSSHADGRLGTFFACGDKDSLRGKEGCVDVQGLDGLGAVRSEFFIIWSIWLKFSFGKRLDFKYSDFKLYPFYLLKLSLGKKALFTTILGDAMLNRIQYCNLIKTYLEPLCRASIFIKSVFLSRKSPVYRTHPSGPSNKNLEIKTQYDIHEN